MATAKKVEIPQPKFTVELSLSQEEAEALFSVGYYKIGGDPGRSRRKHFDSINNALRSLGLKHDNSDISSTSVSIYFNDSI